MRPIRRPTSTTPPQTQASIRRSPSWPSRRPGQLVGEPLVERCAHEDASHVLGCRASGGDSSNRPRSGPRRPRRGERCERGSSCPLHTPNARSTRTGEAPGLQEGRRRRIRSSDAPRGRLVCSPMWGSRKAPWARGNQGSESRRGPYSPHTARSQSTPLNPRVPPREGPPNRAPSPHGHGEISPVPGEMPPARALGSWVTPGPSG